MRLLWRLVRMVFFLVVFLAVREQLSRPPEQRTWYGYVGPIPYDFRIPTWQQVKDAYWNPDDDRLFTRRVLGIGWAINFAQAARIANELRQQSKQLAA